MCFGHSKEPSHQDYSFECPLHVCMFWLRNKKSKPSITSLEACASSIGSEQTVLMHRLGTGSWLLEPWLLANATSTKSHVVALIKTFVFILKQMILS